ncbi:MAG TPA: ATP-binding protein [Solirubrobacteraceae bacterium]|jgi:serine/threonine-protein kinase RsbW/stage II sporulation protein AB (anti-sigma F factor)
MAEAVHPLTTHWTGTWHADPDAVSAIRHALVRYADTAGASERTRDAIGLAVSEAATNAVVHAYVDHDRPGSIVVTAWLLDARSLRIVVADDGRGMQPRTDSPGLGLGLPLMAQVAQKVQIESAPRRGTEVTLDFQLLT